MSDLLLPFQLPFMQSAFAIAAIVAVPAAILSCFLVLKGWALMGDAVAHAILPGVVLAWLAGAPLLLGAFAAGLSCAALSGWLADNSRVKRDTILGVTFSAFFALGLVLYVAYPSDMHLDHILFGNLLGTGRAEILSALAIGAPVTAILLLRWRDWLLHAFDPAQAQAVGLPGRALHYGLLAILAATVVAVLTSVGLILAVALMVTPGAIGFLAARRFGPMMAVAVLSALLAMVGGVYASFWIDSAPAPTAVCLLTLLFLAAYAARRVSARRTARTAQTMR